MVRLGGEGTSLVEEFAAAEVGVVLGLSTPSARNRLADALDLVHRHPDTLAALESGRVDDFRARLLVQGTRRLPADKARGIEARLLSTLVRWSPLTMRDRVKAEVIAADAAAADRERDRSRALRNDNDAAEAGDADSRPVPSTVLYVHLHEDATGARRWRCEQTGPLTPAEAVDLVGHSHVTLRTVIDLAHTEPSAGYQPSPTLVEAVRLLFETDVFPTPPRARDCATRTTTFPTRSDRPAWATCPRRPGCTIV